MATKKDYILVAQAIRTIRSSISSRPDTGSDVTLRRLITELGLRFQRENSRYDHDKFIEAIYGNQD